MRIARVDVPHLVRDAGTTEVGEAAELQLPFPRRRRRIARAPLWSATALRCSLGP